MIIHFAAESHVDRSYYNVSDFVQTNIKGTQSLLELVRKHSIPRFVHISTDEIYGDIPNGMVDESAPLLPSNPYAASKASADMLVQSYGKVYDIPFIIIRSSNNFGPYQYPEKFIPLTITNIIEGKKIPIHGTGVHVRSWLFVEDFCSAVDTIIHKGKNQNIYNISEDERTNLQVLTLIAELFNLNIAQFKEHTSDRPAADLRYAPDSTKLQNELSWKRNNDFETTIKDVVSWYSNNQDW